jgi:hypothetical protein
MPQVAARITQLAPFESRKQERNRSAGILPAILFGVTRAKTAGGTPALRLIDCLS